MTAGCSLLFTFLTAAVPQENRRLWRFEITYTTFYYCNFKHINYRAFQVANRPLSTTNPSKMDPKYMAEEYEQSRGNF
jgi:hypothetical protein